MIFSSWQNTQELRLQEPVSEQRHRLLGSPWGLVAAPGPTPSGCTSLPTCLPSGQGLLYLKEKVSWQVLVLPSQGQFLKGELEGPTGAGQAAPSLRANFG